MIKVSDLHIIYEIAIIIVVRCAYNIFELIKLISL